MKYFYDIIIYDYYDENNFDIDSIGHFKTLRQALLKAKSIKNAQYISKYNDQELVANYDLNGKEL